MGNRGPTHSSCIPGKRVIIRLRNGNEIRGKFEAKHSRYIVVAGQKITRESIDSFIIEKHALQHGGLLTGRV